MYTVKLRVLSPPPSFLLSLSLSPRLSQQTVGVIVRLEKEAFKVLTQHGKEVNVPQHAITLRKTRAVALDNKQNSITSKDIVKVIQGPHLVSQHSSTSSAFIVLSDLPTVVHVYSQECIRESRQLTNSSIAANFDSMTSRLLRSWYKNVMLFSQNVAAILLYVQCKLRNIPNTCTLLIHCVCSSVFSKY